MDRPCPVCVDTRACPRARDVADTASSEMIDTMPTARRGSALVILIGMGTPTHMLPEGMPAHWDWPIRFPGV